MGELFEAVMVICFGISWPASIYNSVKAKTAKGKSLLFLCCILVGYLCGIVSKIVNRNVTYVLFFYILNFIMVFTDLLLYFRNRKIDMQRSATAE